MCDALSTLSPRFHGGDQELTQCCNPTAVLLTTSDGSVVPSQIIPDWASRALSSQCIVDDAQPLGLDRDQAVQLLDAAATPEPGITP